MRRLGREVTAEIRADVEAGRSGTLGSRWDVFPRMSTRAPEFDEGTNERETSSLSWKHPADLVQFPLRRRLDAQRCSDMRNALPMPRVSRRNKVLSLLLPYPAHFFPFSTMLILDISVARREGSPARGNEASNLNATILVAVSDLTKYGWNY